MRRNLMLLAVGLVLAWQTALPAPTALAHGDGAVEHQTDERTSALVTGNLPSEGVALGLWDGGSVETLGSDQPEVSSLWVTSNGQLVGYLVGAPDFVNTAFLTVHPQGQVPAGTAVLAVISEPVVAPPAPPPAEGYSLATWTAFVDVLLEPTESVADCGGCWPGYSGSTIGVTSRWLETDTLNVYVHAATTEDRAALEAQLNAFQTRLGIPWQYVATAGEANLHVFISFDRLNVPASFPQWARDSIATQSTVPGWSAYATTSSTFLSGPNGIDPVDRYEIDEAAIYVPFNQQNGTLIPRPLLESSIRHELVHAIGWGGHWDVPNRLMSPVSSTELELSELEWSMLELLYADDVLPGMYDEQILEQVTVAGQ